MSLIRTFYELIVNFHDLSLTFLWTFYEFIVYFNEIFYFFMIGRETFEEKLMARTSTLEGHLN